MKMRRLVSSLLAVLLVMSCFSVGIVASSAAVVDNADTAADIDVAAAGSAYADMLSKTTVENNYGLSETVNDGTILQAWTWSFKSIEANLETIAEQGFTTIQVSPPNEIKKGTKGAKFLQSDGKNGWWMFYQPAGFQLNNSTDNALGTKAEFVSMCSKAHELGLKVIVDAVINHMGTKDNDDNNTSTDPMSHVTPKAATFEPEIYNNKLFHSPWKQMQYIESNNTTDASTYDLTRNCTSGLPDLKTEDSRVQTAIYDYMEELVQSGADGFRFDAAKHIETPDDIAKYKSDFWTNTLKKVQNAHPEKEIYAYGEILNTCGIGRPYSMYTKLFDVTDSGSYWQIKNAVTGEYSGNPIPYYPNSNFNTANTMLWDESHDTYVDGSTTKLTTTQRGKIWALVAGRSGISSVYLARPSDSTNTNDLYNITLGDAKKTSWSNATTKAINQFHNYFIGHSEYCSNSGGTAYIERGTSGAMIVNLGGTTNKNVSLKANKLAAGTYKDAITGNTFTVSGGYIKGQVGSTGVAAIYENNAAPEPTDPPKPTDPPETYMLGDVDGNNKVDSLDAVLIMRNVVGTNPFTDKQKLAADVDGDKFVTIIDATLIQRYAARMTVKYPIGEVKEVKDEPDPTIPIIIPTTPDPTQPDPTPKSSFLLTDNFGWGSAYVYAWDADGNELYGAWPGAAQVQTTTNEYGETQFICEVPDGAVGVILNNGNGEQTQDITDFTYDGYWMDGSKNDLGHYIVTGWNSDGPTPGPDPDPAPEPNGSFLLTDNFGWGTAYVYAWDADGNAINGEWPGASQAETVTNDYGETQFRCYVPDGAVGVILSNGNGAQTQDITDFTYDGYWMDGSKNDLGHYLVTGWNYDNPDPDPTPTPDPVITDGSTIIFSNNKGFGKVNIYYWSDEQQPVEWPGVPMTSIGQNEFGEERFTFDMPEGMTNYIITDGDQQTVDIPFTGSTGVYMTDRDSEGHYLVDFYSISDDPGPGPGPDPTPAGSFLLTDNFGWGTAYVYAWDDDGNELNGAWPGSAQAQTTTNEYGETQFVCVVPEGATGVILSNGNGAQTEDITDFTYDGYWMDGTKNDLGHYKVTGWRSNPDPTPTDNPTPVGNDGYYLVGSFSNWEADSQYQLSENSGNPGEYMISTTLSVGDGVKVVKAANGAISTWYPDGMDNEYIVDAAHSGNVTIYFNPSGNSEWSAFGGYFYIEGGSEPGPTPTQGDNPTPTPAGSFLLTDNFGWGTAYVYAWDDDGNELNGEWPGSAQAQTTTNEYGETQFVCVVPEGATGVILSNGNGAQTEDITDFTYDGYWMDGTKNDLGHYKVTGWRSEPDPTPTEPTPTPTEHDNPPLPNNSFLLTDNFGWGTAYVYAWDDDGNELNGAWPGSAQAQTTTNEYGETQFVCVVPEGATGVILSNGNGAQTEDITDFTYDGYWMDGTKNDLGHYKVTGWRSDPDPDPDPTPTPTEPTPTPTEPTPGPDPTPVDSFLLTDNFGWGTAYVYAWDADGNELNGAWPGSAQAKTQVNEYGETQFICEVPAGAAGVILNNGNGAQTEDITDFSYDGYWMDGTKNDLGHYIVTGWNSDPNPNPNPDPDPDPQPDPDPDPQPADGYTVTFSNNKGFSNVYIYYWPDGDNGPVEWPGVAMTSIGQNDYGEEQFSITLPAGMTNFIINDGNSQQTVDVAITGDTGIYLTDTDAAGHYNVEYFGEPTPEPGPDPDPDPVSNSTFLLTDNFGWGTAYVYAWDADGNELNGSWPGSAQAETVTNDYGETQFKCEVPAGAVGVILNNGNGAQTEDITDFSYAGYWMDGSKNDLGHYKVTGWN